MATEQDNDDLLLGRRAVEMGLISPSQLKTALAEQSRLARENGEAPSLGYVLVSKRLIPEQQLVSLLWDDELVRSDAEIKDFLESFDDKKDADDEDDGTSTKRVALVKEGDVRLGKYLLLREAGRGGMAVVYEAQPDGSEERVALKLLLPSSRIDPQEAAVDEERFIREARLSAQLPSHPHIVKILETGVVDGRRFIAMEFIAGREMGQWWRRSYASTRMQVRVLRDVALAIHHAHQHGVIHRDLKPSNIIIDERNQPHVTDFGLARGLKRSGEQSLTLEDRVVGTPIYMSPEQAEGKKTVDRRSDVYSLGVLLYEILAGRPPFTGSSAMEIMVKVARDPVPPPSAAMKKGLRSTPDKALEGICMRALTKAPKDRIPTAKVFADELSAWLREKGGAAGSLQAYKMFAWTGVAAAGIAVLLLVLALSGAFSRPAKGASPGAPPKPGPVEKTPSPPPAAASLQPLALEAEKATDVVVTHGKTSVQRLASCSEGAQLFWTGGRPQSQMKLPLRMSADGRATLLIRMTKAQDYAIVRFSLNGERISEDLDLYSPEAQASPVYRFQRLPFKKGVNELEIKIIGTNPKASPAAPTSDLFQVGLDRLEVQP